MGVDQRVVGESGENDMRARAEVQEMIEVGGVLDYKFQEPEPVGG